MVETARFHCTKQNQCQALGGVHWLQLLPSYHKIQRAILRKIHMTDFTIILFTKKKIPAQIFMFNTWPHVSMYICVGVSKLNEAKRTQTFPRRSNHRIPYLWSGVHYEPLTVLLKNVQPWMSADLHSWKDKWWTCMRLKHRTHVGGLYIKITLFPRNTIVYRWEWSHSTVNERKDHTVLLKAEMSLDVLTGK